YVSGIGGQIDSGAWEKLEPEKRLDGFDHTFLWVTDEDVVLGQLWSSTDRKGRSKYPMVICVHGERLSPDLLLTQPRAALEHLRKDCRASDSANHVAIACQATQDQVRSWLKQQTSGSIPAFLDDSKKKSFIQQLAQCGNQHGLSRLMHELD